MKSQEITKKQYEKIAKELEQQNTDFFGNNQLSTLSNSADSYAILTFDNTDERDSFIEDWHKIVTISQRDRGYKGKIEKLKV